MAASTTTGAPLTFDLIRFVGPTWRFGMPTFDTIVLLTGQVEQPVLTTVLRGHNPLLTIQPAETLTDLAALEPELLRRARLIAFSSGVIVPAKVLDQLGCGAYNFHPGSPDFPGWSPARFAVHRRVTEFGATAHFMAERVDSGPDCRH